MSRGDVGIAPYANPEITRRTPLAFPWGKVAPRSGVG